MFIPTFPGLKDYPDLRAAMDRELTALYSMHSGCGCNKSDDTAKIVHKYKDLVAKRKIASKRPLR
jgi:hypothetical protein